jgi:predicted RNA binding protein YcfA (HicA-like mRNA interferase family)
VTPSKQSTTRTKGRVGPVNLQKRRPVSYGSLTTALERLGYVKFSVERSHVVFSHPRTEARIFLPWRPDTTTVDAARLAGVYQLVESAGIASRQEVQDVLNDMRSSDGTPRPGGIHHRPAAVHHKKRALPSRDTAKQK